MPTDEILAYNVQYFDERAQLIREYRLNSYKDGTLELLDIKSNKMYLKRIYCPDVPRERLFVGSVVNVYGRALQVLEAADLGTGMYSRSRTSSAKGAAVIADAQDLPSVMAALQGRFTSLRALRTVAVADLAADVRDALADGGPARGLALIVDVYTQGSQTAPSDLADTLTACSTVTAFVALPDGHPVSGRNSAAAELAAGAPATLCLIKPHVVEERRVGELLATIVECGFELAGLQLTTLDAKMVHEFFAPYKGVWPRHEDVVAHCLEGPALAVQIRSDVASFRELCGPSDIKLAQTLRPKSLRAGFGTSIVRNAVHCTDLEEDGFLECNYFFNVLQGVLA